MTYDECTKQLPTDAKWSSSFGNPGEGGFTEFWRDASGIRYAISNGRYDAVQPFNWHFKREA